jgi:hypothetical protein
MGQMRKTSIILVGKLQRWKTCIKMDVTEIRREGVDWSQLAKGREQKQSTIKTVVNLRAP